MTPQEWARKITMSATETPADFLANLTVDMLRGDILIRKFNVETKGVGQYEWVGGVRPSLTVALVLVPQLPNPVPLDRTSILGPADQLEGDEDDD